MFRERRLLDAILRREDAKRRGKVAGGRNGGDEVEKGRSGAGGREDGADEKCMMTDETKKEEVRGSRRAKGGRDGG